MAIVEYFKQKIDSTKVGKTMGRFYKCMMTCVQCCLECVARLVEFINKHAYIQVLFSNFKIFRLRLKETASVFLPSKASGWSSVI